jgi:hypothetical protein
MRNRCRIEKTGQVAQFNTVFEQYDPWTEPQLNLR